MAHDLPANVYARDIMVPRNKLVTLKPDMDVFQGIEILVKNRISGGPVIDSDGKFLGVFSEKSCMHILVDAVYEQLPTNRIDAFMDRSPNTVDEKTMLLSIAQLFLTTPRRRLPVLKNGELVGQVSRRDVVKATLDIVRKSPSHEKNLLYLSALRERSDAPID